MNEFGDYTDDQVEAILNAFDGSGEDSALTSFVAGARSIATRPVDAHVTRRHVRMLAHAARMTLSDAGTQKGERARGQRATNTGTLTARKRHLVTKAAVVGPQS
jgi:hypothetical protein